MDRGMGFQMNGDGALSSTSSLGLVGWSFFETESHKIGISCEEELFKSPEHAQMQEEKCISLIQSPH